MPFQLVDANRFDPRVVSMEERIVLIQARSPNSALIKADREATRYAETTVNQLGQKLTCRRVGAINVFRLAETPGAGVEVFSSTLIKTKDEATSLIKSVDQSREGFGFFEPDLWLTSQSVTRRKGK